MSLLQILALFHIFVSGLYGLLLRQFAKNNQAIKTNSMFIIFAFGATPLVVLAAILMGGIDFNINAIDLALLIVGSVFYAAGNSFVLQANKKVDAAQIAIISNVQIALVVLGSVLLLGDFPNKSELLGIVLLSAAALLVSLESLNFRKLQFKKASWLVVAASLSYGTAQVIESIAIQNISVSTYLLVVWPMTALFLYLISFNESKSIRGSLTNRQIMQLLGLGAILAMIGISFTGAVFLYGNASLIVTARSYRVVIIFILAYIFLKEKTDIWRKLIGTIIATLGVYLVF